MKDSEIDDLLEVALKVSPGFKPENDLRDEVVKLIRRKENRVQKRTYFLMALGILMFLFVGVAFVSTYVDSLFKDVSASLIRGAVLLGAIIVLFQYLDKRLVKNRLIQKLVDDLPLQ